MTTNFNGTADTGHIASDSFLSFFRQFSTPQQATIRDTISTFDTEHDNNNNFTIASPTTELNNTTDNKTENDVTSSTPKMNNALNVNQELQESSDSDDSADQLTLIKILVWSMNDFALNQSWMIQHKNYLAVPFLLILSKLRKFLPTILTQNKLN